MKNSIRVLSVAGALVCLVAGSLVHFSFGFGLCCLRFSSLTILPPLLSLLVPTSLIPLVISFLLGIKFLGYSPLVAAGLPTIAATLKWNLNRRYQDFVLSVVVPVVCMSLFVAHPVGGVAWMYSLYWLIPSVLFCIERRGYSSVVSTAISSVFLSHAVGSVLWLYSLPSTSDYWISIIPCVAVERAVFALTMVGVYYACRLVVGAIQFMSKQKQERIR